MGSNDDREDVNTALELANEEELNTWEDEFVRSIADQLDRGRELTMAQSDKLAEILKRHD